MIGWNPKGDYPAVAESSYIHISAVVIGNVKIGKKVFVGPGAIIRADQPNSSITIGDNCNIQDLVIIHALDNASVEIGEETSLTHSCVVHGPCRIGRKCFIGFNSIIFKTELQDNVIVKHNAVVEEVKIPSGILIPSGIVVDSNYKIENLEMASDEMREFSQKVVKGNLDLVMGYKKCIRQYS